MRKQWLSIVLCISVPTLVWWVSSAEFVTANSLDVFRMRAVLIQLTGVLALTFIAMCMLLAMRFDWLERVTHGLDKAYCLHKWMGICALIVTCFHWLLVKSPGILIGWGIISAPSRGHSGWHINSDALQAWVSSLRASALFSGEVAFYTLLVLIAVALLSLVGYRRFRLTHKLMALVALLVVYHSVLLIKRTYWPELITPYIVVIGCMIVWMALRSLLGRIGKSHYYPAHVLAVEYHPENKTTRLELHAANWPGHLCGQYAYLHFAHESPHPFTITCCQNTRHNIEFLIKDLGEFTHRLHQCVHVGDRLLVEGPYGAFSLSDSQPSIWIAGGAGIAGFKAALEHRAQTQCHNPVNLYYCTLTPDHELIEELTALSEQANVTFQLVDNRSQPLLNVKKLIRDVPDIRQYSIWFCGPQAFANSLKRHLKRIGFPLGHFHYEMFQLR